MATSEHNPKINYIPCDGCVERDKRIAALVRALRPFADEWEQFLENWPEGDDAYDGDAIAPMIEVEHFIDALKALKAVRGG